MKKIIIQSVAKWMLCIPLFLAFGCASFDLTSSPSADIYENGEKIAVTPYSFSLMSGMRKFTLKRAGYVEEEVTVSSMDKKILHFQLQWVGRTRIDTLPRGADVLRASDRVKLGVTPCGLHLAVPESVLIKKDGYETIEYDLTPNERYVLELKPTAGFKSAYYKDIAFTSDLGKVEIHDRVAGEKIGTTPVRLTLEAGSELEYRLAGFRSRTTLVSRRAPHRIHIELEPITLVTILGPPGAQVYRAGGVVPLGTVPYTVEIGNDTLFDVRKEGYYDSTVALAAGSSPKMDVGLREIPYKTIVTEPAGAGVYRLGGLEKLGESPFTTVADSELVFEIRKKGFRTSVIGVGPSSPTSLQVPLTTAPRDDPDAAALGTLDSSVISTY